MSEIAGATELELQAIKLRWRAQHPGAREEDGPTAEESATLLGEIRDRVAAIEGETQKMLMQATRNAPSRSGANSRYMPIVAVLFLLAILASLISLYAGSIHH